MKKHESGINKESCYIENLWLKKNTTFIVLSSKLQINYNSQTTS